MLLPDLVWRGAGQAGLFDRLDRGRSADLMAVVDRIDRPHGWPADGV